jgi:hypothetical protein
VSVCAGRATASSAVRPPGRVAFTRTLIVDGKECLLDQPLRDGLAQGIARRRPEPVLLTMSDLDGTDLHFPEV